MKKKILPLCQIFMLPGFLIFTSCNSQRQISRSIRVVLADSSLSRAHVGISIYEPATGKYWCHYQGNHYFVPASNTKIATCYAAMKYLGDSLVGMWEVENDTAIFCLPGGDPTLLHADFKRQPLVEFLQKAGKNIYTTDLNWKDEALGAGWAWSDYNDDYMAERSALPVYGNLVKWVTEEGTEGPLVYSIPEVNWTVNFDTAVTRNFYVERALGENSYQISLGTGGSKQQDVPFVTNGIRTSVELLSDTVHKTIRFCAPSIFKTRFSQGPAAPRPIYTQPTDSMLKPMMHRSDNFFAEQSLLMVSNALLGIMNDQRIIDTLMKTDFNDLPQRPRWVDGSGLSRYNLFSPDDMVSILNKMKAGFGMERIKNIFPTGNEGTLAGYYVQERGQIFAKTGSLSGVIAISGFLYTASNKLLIFSVLVNNHNGSAMEIRRAVERFIETIRNHY